MPNQYIGHDAPGPGISRTQPLPQAHIEDTLKKVFSVRHGYVLCLVHNRRCVQIKELGKNQLVGFPEPQQPPQLAQAGVYYRQPTPPGHMANVLRDLFAGGNGFVLLRMENGLVTEMRKVPRDQVAVPEHDLSSKEVVEALRALAVEEGGDEAEKAAKRGKRKLRPEELVGIDQQK